MSEKRIYTVSELTRSVRGMIEGTFPGVWVEGEIANFVLHSSGHMYFSLRDPSASLKCAMFSRANGRLKFQPKNGMRVIAYGKMSVYEPRGDYQLIAAELEPKGVGALQLAFQQLKEKLLKEGLFDEGHKVPVPHLPTRIGVVTSPTGAAIRDILTVTRRRFANIEIVIAPVRVQGAGSADEIAAAIRDLNAYGAVDVMIVGRGGGSLEDLWAFNEEVVARAIYESAIPVISAVGHEIDYTISDFVADLRAATPSAAAELVIPRKEDLRQAIRSAAARMKAALTAKLDMAGGQLARLAESRALRDPFTLITQYQQHIDELRRDLSIRIAHSVEMQGGRFKHLTGKLEALSPLAILNRGYSITTKIRDGVIVKDALQLKCGDEIETQLGAGRIRSSVREIEERDKGQGPRGKG